MVKKKYHKQLDFHNFNSILLFFSGGITDQIDKQFKTYAFIKPKLIHAKHKREIQSTKTDPVSSYFKILFLFLKCIKM